MRSPCATRRPAAGFTLVEIALVVTLIGIVAGFAISRVGFSRYRMDANARLLQNVIMGAQQAAITRNVTVQLTFDAVNHRLRILEDANGNEAMDSGERVTYRMLAEQAKFLSPATTVDGEASNYLTGAGKVEPGNPLQLAVRIYPNGSTSGDVYVYFGTQTDRPNDFRALRIIGATARTSFWRYVNGVWIQADN